MTQQFRKCKWSSLPHYTMMCECVMCPLLLPLLLAAVLLCCQGILYQHAGSSQLPTRSSGYGCSVFCKYFKLYMYTLCPLTSLERSISYSKDAIMLISYQIHSAVVLVVKYPCCFLLRRYCNERPLVHILYDAE